VLTVWMPSVTRRALRQWFYLEVALFQVGKPVS
jgi:hypothetical protein